MRKALILAVLISLVMTANVFAGSFTYVVKQGGTGKVKVKEPAYDGQGSGGHYTLVCSNGRVFTTDYRYGRADSSSHLIWYTDDNGRTNKVCGLRQFN